MAVTEDLLNAPDAPSVEPDPVAPTADAHRSRWPRPSRNAWTTAAIGALTTVLYAWNLGEVGNGNEYYAAAVKSATVSWKALFFASLDPGSFITVDKPPAAIWMQGLSARIFGFSTWSMILPEVLMGVASVLILHRLVRRWKGHTAAHLAALAFALTPIATAMFRSNNPDAMLTLLGLGAAWGVWNAVESGRTRPLLVAATLTGLAFNTKMLQALLVLPALAIVYLVAGPPKLGRRFGQLLMALGVLVALAGWYPVVVSLWPTSSRPYIGSTTNNSIVSLMLGYNGLDRVFGSGSGSGGGPGGSGSGPSFGGSPGTARMFNDVVGGQVGWLIPFALAGLLAGLWLRRAAGRTDRQLAGWLLWGGWALVSMAVFSYSKGIFHPYYTVQLAPAIAALAGGGAVALWELGRRHRSLRLVLPVVVAVSAGWSVALLRRTTGYHTGLRTLIVVGGTVAAAGFVAGIVAKHRPIVLASGALAAVTLLAGPGAYAVTTVAHPQSGPLTAAGPSTVGTGRGGFGGGRRADDPRLSDFLVAHRGSAKYIVAGTSAGSTEQIIIDTGLPVITIGGFNGGDPTPTLAEFQQLVRDGKVRYVLVGGGFGGDGNDGAGAGGSILAWVKQVGATVTAGSATLYDLAAASTGATA